MVLGLFEGELDLLIGSTNYSAGQKISGSIRLKLPKPLKARGLRVSFYGEIYDPDFTERVFVITAKLSGEKLYSTGENYNFELQLPESFAPPKFEGPYADALNKFMPKPQNWFVHATLDLPHKLDINKRVLVKIVSFGPPPAIISTANRAEFEKAGSILYQYGRPSLRKSLQ